MKHKFEVWDTKKRTMYKANEINKNPNLEELIEELNANGAEITNGDNIFVVCQYGNLLLLDGYRNCAMVERYFEDNKRFIIIMDITYEL